MRLLEQIITEFESLELNNELYILGDLNINLLFKGNCILNKTHEIKNYFKEFSPEIKKYNEFCLIYSFKQLVNCPTGKPVTPPLSLTIFSQIHRITSPSLVVLILLYQITI